MYNLNKGKDLIRNLGSNSNKNNPIIAANITKIWLEEAALELIPQTNNPTIKEEIKENKIKENDKIKEKVQKLKDKQINDLNILKKNLKSNQENKKRKKEEEKNYIKNELSLQKDKNKKELEKKKLINLQKNQNKAERIQGNEVYLLQKIKNDLESKIKVQETIYNKMNKQYYDYVQTTINDECILNSLWLIF